MKIFEADYIRNNNSFLLFLLVVVAYVFSRTVENETLVHIIKPMLSISLITFYFSNTRKVDYVFIISLLLFFVGDIIFLLDGIFNFLMGLAFYFIAVLITISVMVERIGVIRSKEFFPPFIPILSVILSICYILFVDIGCLKILLFIFASLVAIMLSVAYCYYSKKVKKSSLFLLYGVVLYIVNAIFTGINKLIEPNIYFSAIDSATYAISLFCICYFVILEDNENFNSRV